MNVNWQVIAASIELAGNLFACFAALVWASLTGYVWRKVSPTVLLVSVAVFAFTNANYALFQILRYGADWIDVWDTEYEQVILWMQQLASIVLPLSAVFTWLMMSNERLKRVTR
jgi:hypothetical protein